MSDKKVSLEYVLEQVFCNHKVRIEKNIVFGKGEIKGQEFHILGSTEDTFLGVEEAHFMAGKVLEILEDENDTRPIFLPVDVIGQKLSMRDEWLGMYGYFSHLLQALHLARKGGHKLFSLVYNQAIGGSFIAYGLMADKIYALSHAKVAVMWLSAMAKVTKIEESVLEEASKTSAVFAPGVENFKKLGGLHNVLELEKVASQLMYNLKENALTVDNRAKLGDELGGRTKAFQVINDVLAS